MDKDEKLKSREEEQRAADPEEQSSPQTSAEGDNAQPSGASDATGMDTSFGMPAFDFPHEKKAGSRGGSDAANAGSASAPGSADLPLDEGTGWESGSSIERQGSLKARMHHHEDHTSYGDSDIPGRDDMPQDETVPRSNATVMPFPGTTLSRPPEPTPVDFLPEDDGNEFSEYGGGILPEVSEYEAEEQENLADAVQSALRNVYGARSNEGWDEDGSGAFTVADSLMGSESRSDAIWAQVQERSNEAYLEDEQEEAAAEANTEAVLDYLYGRRRNDLDETQVLTLDTALKDFEPAPGYEPDWRDHDDEEERVTQYPGVQREAEPAFRSPPSGDDMGRYGDGGQSVQGSPESQRWEQSGYRLPARAGQPYPSAAPEQLSGGSDSGHLLGAAGLGLIGGIALAGVLAVFVFNSFVDVNETTTGGPNKVTERLAATTGGDRMADYRDRPAPVELRPSTSDGAALSVRPVTGYASEPIRLDISVVDPALAEDALVSIKGLPRDARLSTGIDVGGGQWLLPPARLSNLTVSVPPATAGSFNLVAQLLKDDAQTTLSDQAPFTLTVTSKVASAEPARGTAQGDEQAQIETDFLTQMLIRDGNKQMRDGDIIAARRLYEQATMSGSPEAALAMGRSYDPTYFEKLTIKTGKPDPAAAFEWYKKALDGGLSTARIKIDALKQWLQK